MAYGVDGSWRRIYHYIWAAINNDPDISCNELFSDTKTQHILQHQFHLLGKEKTEEKFCAMFKSISGGEEGCVEDEEMDMGGDDGGDDAGGDEGGEMVSESFNRILGRIIRRTR